MYKAKQTYTWVYARRGCRRNLPVYMSCNGTRKAHACLLRTLHPEYRSTNSPTCTLNPQRHAGGAVSFAFRLGLFCLQTRSLLPNPNDKQAELERDLQKMVLQQKGLTREELVDKAMNDSALVQKHAATAGDTIQKEGKRAWLLGQVC